MRHSESITNVAAKLAAVQHAAPRVPKSNVPHSGPRYNYASLEDYDDVVAPLLREHGLLVVFSADKLTQLQPRLLADGKRFEQAVAIEISATVIDPASGEWIEVVAAGEDQSMTGKATYGAMTGARKYALAALFNLVTSEDPEKGQQTTGAAPQQQAPPPQQQVQQPPTDTGGLTVVSVVKKKEGENANGHWNLWTINASDGEAYDTFSDADADTATALMASNTAADIQWQQGKYGKQIKTIAPAAGEPQQQAPPPVQEGPPLALAGTEKAAPREINVRVDTTDEREAMHNGQKVTVVGINTDQGRFGCLDPSLFDAVKALAGTDGSVTFTYETTGQGRLVTKIDEIPF